MSKLIQPKWLHENKNNFLILDCRFKLSDANYGLDSYKKEHIENAVFINFEKELAGEMGYAKEVKEFKANPGVYKAHVGDVSTVLRVALTKRTNTPDMYEIMHVLGKDVIESRFEIAKENLK